MIIQGVCNMDKLTVLIAEVVAGLIVVLALFGYSTGLVADYVTIDEATGMWLVIFLVMLLLIDIFMIVYTLRAWERE